MKRQSNIELLRLVLMFMIVLLHVFDNQIVVQYNNKVFVMQSIVSTLCIVAVNCFVFISGYFGIKFKTKSFISLGIQALFYSWTILSIFLLLGKNISYVQIIHNLLPISSGVWWFLTVYLVLVIISPLLNLAIEYFTKRQFFILLVGLLLFDLLSFFFSLEIVAGKGYSVYHFVVIYCIARYMSKYQIYLRRGLVWYLAPVLMIVIFSSFPYFSFNRVTAIYSLWEYNNPLLIMSAIGLFFIFKKMKFNNEFINKIAPLSFAVYLIHNHALVWSQGGELIKYLTETYQNKVIILFFVLLLFSISIFIVCLCIEKIRQYIFNPVVDRIEKKLSKYNLNIF
ncbi:acyltransferase [Dysgonomonas sp. 520]|uniref:acyltransferase family protein n=1 Tax=Dysgonomonas sp. 520 TaxID=2302931 RepID=UPI0013D070B1|nr:acyltransferase [Dysgonomonas sp. 520]NDW09053.1 hypothetical protein [Dysgonomonas sp. 520]